MRPCQTMSGHSEALTLSPRPADWRAPTLGEHACARCGGLAVFGLGADYFCRTHVPRGFLPHQMADRA